MPKIAPIGKRREISMALLHRLIFRVDFDNNFGLADRPGSVIKTLMDASDDYWEFVGPTTTVFQINASNSTTNQKLGRYARSNFSVDTYAIGGSFEFADGLEFGQMLNEKYLAVCSNSLDLLIANFGFKSFNRVGVRLFITGGETSDFVRHKRRVAERFSKIAVRSDLLSGIELSDFAQILVGELDHDVKFRLQSGPGNTDDIKQFLQRAILDEEIKRPPHEFTADIDIFQENINFKGTNLLRWIKAKQAYLEKLLAIAAHSARVEKENVDA